MPRKKRSVNSPNSVIVFTSAVNEKGKKQLCVYAQCIWSDKVVGPIWSHADGAIRLALLTLTRKCDCPASFHKALEYKGKRIAPTKH